MSKKADESDLGISLKDVASILETGKKLTRGAKNQLKISASEKQIGEKQSEVSFDSKKSIETKNAKKLDKNAKKKQVSVKSAKMTINDYMGLPDLQSYIASEDLAPKYHFSLDRFSVGQLGKNYLPSPMRVILKNHMTKQHYEVKRGELKKQKTTREQFIIDFNHSLGGRSDVRSINKDNGIVLVGENLAMLKLNFKEWKQIFSEQIEDFKKEFFRSTEEEQSHKMDEQKQKTLVFGQEKYFSDGNVCDQKSPAMNLPPLINSNASNQFEENKKLVQKCFFIEEEKSLQFVQIKKNQSLQIFISESEFDKSKESRLEQHSEGHIPFQVRQKEKQKDDFDEKKLFSKFCMPGYDFILWPVLIYEPVIGDPEQAIEIIKNKQYAFNDKDKTQNLFDLIAKSSQGIFHPQLSGEIKSQSFISQSPPHYQDHPELLRFLTNFQNSILPRIQNQIIVENPQNQSQINLIVYLFGSGKFFFVESHEEIAQKLFTWNTFSTQFTNFYLLNSLMKEAGQEISQTIDKLNEFGKFQVSECKSDEIRNSIDRLVKCSIEDKIYNGITLRYSNIQKKVLVLLFRSNKTTRNELIWLNLEHIYPNYTLPQLNVKNKFLLYFSNFKTTTQQKSLTEFLLDIYATYFCKNEPSIIFTKGYYQNPSILSESSQNIGNASILNRCIQCFYPIHKLAFFKCCFCEKYCHKECSTKAVNKSIEVNFQGMNDLWTCNSCQPCTLCLQPLNNKRISCMKCSNMFHQVCGKLKMQDNTLHRDRYLCENCIQCKVCEKKLKNLDYVLMKGGYQCVSCYKAQQANEICHICKKQGDGRWAQCSRQFCGKWIHKNCDKYIQSRNSFFSNNNEEVYFCPFCRRVEKRRVILKFIEVLMVFDEYQYFVGSDYEDLLDYKYVIVNPMCFRKMYERCHEGAYDENTKESLMKDFELLITNALKYNMPKDQPHYQARILNILGSFTFDKFHSLLECTQEDLIQGHLLTTLNEKKRQLYREIYDRYLEIILNYKSQHSIVQVKKPKQAVSKGEKLSYLQGSQLQPFVFSSRHLLKDVFKSATLKFKIIKKSSTIQNLFDIHKVVQAYKCPIKENFCFYHYWNSNVIFYCEICMEHYCCATKCYKHHICTQCGIKGCACDTNECGCPPLKEREKKVYEKLIHQRYYDRRQITQNFTLCLRCACQKLNNKICCYCQKAYEFYYDFQTCKDCGKIYHKECGDVHASETLSKFFFKKQKIFPNQELFSSTLRLDKACYECSTSRVNKTQMYEKLKSDSLSKLMKLQKLCKYQLLISSIYHENGIKISLNEILVLILNNYEDFLKYETLFQEYRMNLPSIRLNTKLSGKVEQRTYQMVKSRNYHKVNEGKVLTEYAIQMIKKKSPLDGFLCFGSVNKLSLQNMTQNNQVWKQKIVRKARDLISKHLILHIPKHQEHSRNLKTDIIFDEYEKYKIFLKIKKIQESGQQINAVNMVSQPSSKKNINVSSSEKIPVWTKSLFQGAGNSAKNPGQKSNTEKDDKAIPIEFLSFLYGENCFKTITQIQIDTIEKVRSEFILSLALQDKKRVGLLADVRSNVLKSNYLFSIASPIFYEKQSIEKIEEEQESENEKADPEQVNQIYIGIGEINRQIDIEAQLQLAIKKMYEDPQCESQQQTNVSVPEVERKIMKMHQSHTNMSKISKYKRLSTTHKIISKFLLQCFEFNKSVYRRGNTCILKSQAENWRVLKKGKNNSHQISLKKQHGKWYFSIDQNTWWIESIEQMISKLKPLAELSNFRELADFLGFTFKFVPTEKAVHFTRFLQTNPLEDLSPKQKKQVIVELYDRLEWMKSGSFKTKTTQIGKEETKEFTITKKKIFYLNKRKPKNGNEQHKRKVNSSPPYISFEDIKKDLEDVIEAKKQEPLILTEPGDNVFIGPSPIHKLGLFAKSNYPKHTTMIEYIGEVVSESMADVRQSRFHFGCYMFGLNRRNCDKRQIIDATYKGNMARYLNHSCDPNCKARIEMVNGQPSIFIYSIRQINQFEELTYDYQFSVDANQKLICTCGAKSCQGRLN